MKRRYRRLSQQEEAWAVDALLQGRSAFSIQEELGTGSTTIVKLAYRNGLKFKQRESGPSGTGHWYRVHDADTGHR